MGKIMLSQLIIIAYFPSTKHSRNGEERRKEGRIGDGADEEERGGRRGNYEKGREKGERNRRMV